MWKKIKIEFCMGQVKLKYFYESRTPVEVRAGFRERIIVKQGDFVTLGLDKVIWRRGPGSSYVICQAEREEGPAEAAQKDVQKNVVSKCQAEKKCSVEKE